VHLTDFGTLRIHTQFGPLDGETVERTEGKQKRVVLAPGNARRQAIEAAFLKIPWLAEANYTPEGTRPDFNLSPSGGVVRAEFKPGPNQVIEVSKLLDALSRAGAPPVSMRVARMGAGVPFGFPLPGDVGVVDPEGKKRRSGQLQKPGRPLVVVFFPLKGTYTAGKEERTYRAQPTHFSRLKEVAGKYANRADFVAVGGANGDAFADVTALWRKADMPFPVLQDPQQKLATALSAGLSNPPPHLFIVDAQGKLRYAGEFADGWIEPDRIKRVYLTEALDRVLEGKYAANGAAFYNSPPCGCSAPACHCPKCGCGGPCRCGCPTGKG
jgi:peroxiredoxin